MAPYHQMSADEEFARRLQAEMDEEAAVEASFLDQYPSYSFDDVPSSSIPRDAATGTRRAPKQTTSMSALLSDTDDLPVQVEADLEFLQEFHSVIASRRCYKCQSHIERDFDPKTHLENWSNATGPPGFTTSICAAMCPKSACRAATCLGCGRKPTIGINTIKIDNRFLDWCCDMGRLFAIWVCLARYDQVELKIQETEAQKAAGKAETSKSARHGHRKNHVVNKDKGKGYVSNRGFDDFSAMINETTMYGPRSVKAINFQSTDNLTDDVLTQLLKLISLLLPSPARQLGSAFDKNPPPALKAALRLGLLVDKVARLLRNDSIVDISKRSSVYFAAINFVRALGNHQSTVDLVTHERYYKRQTSGLLALSSSGLGGSPKCKARAANHGPVVLGDPKDGYAPALIRQLGNLVKQSHIMLGFGLAKEEVQSSTDQATMQLCEIILEVHAIITSSISMEEEDQELALLTKSLRATKIKAWTEYHRENCFQLTEAVLDRHHYKRAMEQLHSPKGRIPYLMKEMASLATSLPEGIFVKASSEVPGFMKCLIVGPEDTPYENGLFEFDTLADSDYPIRPPHVFFTGTHNGYADMNPNLHRDGEDRFLTEVHTHNAPSLIEITVCLSLLGTFDGPPESKWQAKKSTVLSVLVSIQGMILNDEPWRNEPGNGSAMDCVAQASSRQYTLDRMCLTIQFAILPWLLDPSWRRTIWRDIIKAHFRTHGDKILRTVGKWAKVSPGIRSLREPRSPVEAVVTYAGRGAGKDLLKQLERTLIDI